METSVATDEGLRGSRKRGRPRGFCDEAVLDAAVPVFWEKGYEGASLDDLVRAMKIGRPSLYAAFGDKRGLFLRVLERYGVTHGACGTVALSKERVREALEGFLAATLRSNTGAGQPAGCLVGSSVGASLGTVEGVGEVVRSLDSQTQATICDRLSAAVDAGELSGDFPVRERARLLIDLMHAQAYRARAGEGFEELMPEVASKVAAVLR